MTGGLDPLRAALEAALDATRRIDGFAAELRGLGFPVQVSHDGTLPVVVVNITVGERSGRAVDVQKHVPITIAVPDAPKPAPKPKPEPDQRQTAASAIPRKIGPWTDAELAELDRLHASGATVSDISAALGRAPQAVGSFVRKLEDEARAAEDVAPPPPKPAPQPAPPARERWDGWSAKEDLLLVESLSQGRKLPTIAAELRRSPELCKDRFRKLLPNPTMDTQAKLIRALRAEVAA